MIQLSRVGWRLLACENAASPDCVVVVVVVEVVVVVVVQSHMRVCVCAHPRLYYWCCCRMVNCFTRTSETPEGRSATSGSKVQGALLFFCFFCFF